MAYKIVDLKCENRSSPLGVDTIKPRLSWSGQSNQKNTLQTAYQIIVSSSIKKLSQNKGDIWNTKKINSSESNLIAYQGKSLKSHQTYYWKIKIWDQNNIESHWSTISFWSMGILNQKSWKGKWIKYPYGNINHAPYFRKEFITKNKIKKAILYATACGIYEAYINGKKIGNDVFAPGWTDYHQRIHYNTYDITSQLTKKSKHCIGFIASEGWYKGPLSWDQHRNHYGKHIKILANVLIEYENGQTEIISTDNSWKTNVGPILISSFLNGESYDATQELKQWNQYTLNDKNWLKVNTENIETIPLLKSYPTTPVQCTEVLSVKKIWESPKKHFIFDLGQNFSGRVNIKINEKRGTIIRIRYGEMIQEDKSLYVENLRSAISTDTYVAKGTSNETWEPIFTFHGFQFVEVTGITKRPTLKTIQGIVLGSNTERVGHFECSNKMVNQLYSNLVWTQRANFLEIPTDCPQRDERLGWTGDAQVYFKTASYSMDIASFFTKWLTDLKDTQRKDGAVANVAPDIIKNDNSTQNADAAWGDAATICPWLMYERYGDKQILSQHFDMMTKWVDYLKSTSKSYIRSDTFCFGDWLSIGADTPKELIQTAFFAYSTQLTIQAAKVLKKKKQHKQYETLLKKIQKAFENKYILPDGKLSGDTQTAYLLALKFNLIPEKLITKSRKYLIKSIQKKKNHLSTGFAGISYLLPELTKANDLERAYKLLENTTYPSWGYSVVNGATSIWERWNGWTESSGFGNAEMNSYSHYAYGSVGEWLFSTVAGIESNSPGFKTAIIKPQPGGTLTYANATFKSPYGTFKSSWKKLKGKIIFDIEIPTNTTAKFIAPDNFMILHSNLNIKSDSTHEKYIPLGSGKFHFEFEIPM